MSACCFGSISILTLLGTAAGSTLTTLLIGRYGIAFAVLAGILLIRPSQRLPLRRKVVLMICFGGAQALLAYMSLAALGFIPAAMMSFLFYTYPSMVAAAAAVTRTEALTRTRVVALLLSLTGIVLMVGAPWRLEASLVGVLLAVGAGAVYAAYVFFMRRTQNDLPPTAISAYVSLGAGTILLAVGAATGTITWKPSLGAMASMLVLSVVCTVLAFNWFLRGLGVLGSVRTAIVSTVEPFWTALLAAAVLAQPLSGRVLAGGSLIAAAVIVLQLRAR